VLLLPISEVDAGQKATIPDDWEGNQPQVWRPTGLVLQTLLAYTVISEHIRFYFLVFLFYTS